MLLFFTFDIDIGSRSLSNICSELSTVALNLMSLGKFNVWVDIDRHKTKYRKVGQATNYYYVKFGGFRYSLRKNDNVTFFTFDPDIVTLPLSIVWWFQI